MPWILCLLVCCAAWIVCCYGRDLGSWHKHSSTNQSTVSRSWPMRELHSVCRDQLNNTNIAARLDKIIGGILDCLPPQINNLARSGESKSKTEAKKVISGGKWAWALHELVTKLLLDFQWERIVLCASKPDKVLWKQSECTSMELFHGLENIQLSRYVLVKTKADNLKFKSTSALMWQALVTILLRSDHREKLRNSELKLLLFNILN